MNELNWNNFKAKFNGKEQSTFESLSYQLFCCEYGLELGIFKFKNQTGIETEPIQKDNECVGFQAKYYGTKISDNKADIIGYINKAKRENPSLTKILFYLNQEFSESTTEQTKDPQYKIDIENSAKNIDVCIEWRVPSHFERQLALPVNEYLSDYFFCLDESVIDFINNLENHTETLLYSVQDNIKYNDQIIKIDRTQIIKNLENIKLLDKKITIVAETLDKYIAKQKEAKKVEGAVF